MLSRDSISKITFLLLAVFPYSFSHAQSTETPPTTEPVAVAPTTPTAKAKEEDKDPATLKAGVITSVGTFRKYATTDQNLDSSAPGSEPSPVTGSIKRTGTTDCEAVLTNSARSAYSVSFEVVTADRVDGSTRKRSFSATVPAGKSVSRTVSCGRGENIQVVLKSGKKLK